MLTVMELFPASATYHFILLAVPVSLLISSRVLGQRISFTVIALYGLIGFIPYRFFFHLGSSWLPLAYPRLWLITALVLVIITGLLSHNSRNEDESPGHTH